MKIEKPWGWELVFTPQDAPYSGKILFVKAGARLSLQYHEEKQETLVLFSGKAKILIDDVWHDMEETVGFTVVPGQRHRVEAIEDSYLIEAATPEWGKTVRLEDDYQRGDETKEDRHRERIKVK